MNFAEIAGAVARGWCYPINEKKEMDADLAYAITQEIEKLLQAEDSECLPNLGCATTLEIIRELQARAEVAHTIGEAWPSYSTVTSNQDTKP